MKNILSVTAFAFALLPAIVIASGADEQRPNIVLILVDDLGWADLGVHGSEAGLTPNIDRLASQGTRLTQFYATPVCATTRAALLTGRYPFRQWMDWRSEDFGKPDYLELLGMKLAHLPDGTPTRRVMGLDTNERTLAEALKQAGYGTALLGKWHLGEWLPEHLPMGQGFDHQYGHYGWGIDYNNYSIPHNAPAVFAVYDWHRNQQPVFEQGYTTDLIANEAVRLLGERPEGKPFFHFIAFNAIHGPLEEIPRHRDKLDKRSAAIKCLDEAVGRILGAIDQHGLTDDTLVIFANDNGGLTEEVNRPWRGTKNTTYEGGIRVPLILCWPGRIAAGATNDALVSVVDMYPTLVALAGGSLNQELPLDGLDMHGVIFHNQSSPRNELVIEVAGSVRLPTLRRGDFKLVGDGTRNRGKRSRGYCNPTAINGRMVSHCFLLEETLGFTIARRPTRPSVPSQCGFGGVRAGDADVGQRQRDQRRSRSRGDQAQRCAVPAAAAGGDGRRRLRRPRARGGPASLVGHADARAAVPVFCGHRGNYPHAQPPCDHVRPSAA